MPRTSALFFCLLVGIALGVRGWWVLGAEEPALLQYAGRAAVVEGKVADDPDRRSSSVRVMVEVGAVNGEPVSGRALAILSRDTHVQYGDHIEVRGLVEEPQAFQTDTGRTFDYPLYLEARGISVLVSRAEVRAAEEGGWSMLRTLFTLKHTFERALGRVMQEPQASLMGGLLLGEKSGLPERLTDAFIIAGLIHIVVLSGYNIGIVAEWTLRFFTLFFSRRVALLSVAGIVVLFALMAGGGMATVRACLMGLISILARYLKRPALALRSLGVAGVLMVLYNPLALFDVGFILSMLATFGLITLSPWVEKYLTWLPEGGVRSTAATTIAVQLFVLPALLYFTGVLSFVSIPINVLVLPLIPLSMLLGFVAGMLALLHPYAALVPGLLADALLGVVIWLAEVSASLPLAFSIVAAFPAWVVFAVYVPLTAWAILKYQKIALQQQPN